MRHSLFVSSCIPVIPAPRNTISFFRQESILHIHNPLDMRPLCLSVSSMLSVSMFMGPSFANPDDWKLPQTECLLVCPFKQVSVMQGIVNPGARKFLPDDAADIIHLRKTVIRF